VTAPLTSLECELLEAVVEQRENALAVLGDYWIEHVDEARGAFLHLNLGDNRDRIDLADEEARLAAFARTWRAPLLAAGFDERDLPLANGFLQWPLSMPADHPLDGDADLVRISPRYYRETRRVRESCDTIVHEGEAVTPRTRSRVAIKSCLHGDARHLLEREREIVSRFAHPNLPRLVGTAVRAQDPPCGPPAAGARLAIVLAWSGASMRDVVANARVHGRTLGVAVAISVGVQLLAALAELERLAFVHGEVRTDHVTVSADGRVTLIDFGMVRGGPPRAPGSRRDMISSPFVRDEDYQFRYFAPEQARGVGVESPADVFAAAGLISELVANEHPVRSDHPSALDLLFQILQQELVVSPELPAAIGVSLQRALDRDPARRPTARELRDALIDGARWARLDIGPHVIAQRLVELGVPT